MIPANGVPHDLDARRASQLKLNVVHGMVAGLWASQILTGKISSTNSGLIGGKLLRPVGTDLFEMLNGSNLATYYNIPRFGQTGDALMTIVRQHDARSAPKMKFDASTGGMFSGAPGRRSRPAAASSVSADDCYCAPCAARQSLSC
jgi:hypothetical protein